MLPEIQAWHLISYQKTDEPDTNSYLKGNFEVVKDDINDIILQEKKDVSMKTLHHIYGININDTQYCSKLKKRLETHDKPFGHRRVRWRRQRQQWDRKLMIILQCFWENKGLFMFKLYAVFVLQHVWSILLNLLKRQLETLNIMNYTTAFNNHTKTKYRHFFLRNVSIMPNVD